MKLPEQSAQNILAALVSKSLLEESAAKELVETLEKENAVNWALILSGQFEAEQGDHDETQS